MLWYPDTSGVMYTLSSKTVVCVLMVIIALIASITTRCKKCIALESTQR